MSSYYKFDLHIHTPASSCYRGKKEEKEYLEILRSAKNQNLDLIAITDHNTISGYQNLMKIKRERQQKYRLMEEYRDSSVQVSEIVLKLEEDIRLFEDIYIVPGVEITLNPGVHMQVFSAPKDVEQLSALLNIIGYTEERRGKDSEYMIDYDVKKFLSIPELNNLIVVAPHIDSANGINNSSFSGQYRADIMKNEVITAFSCNSLSQKEKLIALFKTDPLYKRVSIPAFINSSDAHDSKDIGAKYSFFKADKCNFNTLITALRNPESDLTDTNEEFLLKSINKQCKNSRVFFLDTLHFNETDELEKIISACLNSGIQYLYLGITKDKKLLGLKNTQEKIREAIDDAFAKTVSSKVGLSYKIYFELLGNGGIVSIINIKVSHRSLWGIKDKNEAYIIDSKGGIKEASVFEIERLVQKNTLEALEIFDKRNRKAISDIDDKLLALQNSVSKFKMQRKIYRRSSYTTHLTNVNIIKTNVIDKSELHKYFVNNGEVSGEVYYVRNFPIRLENAILRFSCPSMNLPLELKETYTELENDALLITTKGGMYLGIKGHKVYTNGEEVLCLQLNDDSDVSVLSVLAWFKSSLFIWYMYTRTFSTNFFEPEVYSETTIPVKILKKINEELSKNVEEILILEKEYLKLETKKEREKTCKECISCDSDDCMHTRKIENHNRKISEKMRCIDELFFTAFDLSADDIEDIYNDLNAAGVFSMID